MKQMEPNEELLMLLILALRAIPSISGASL
jgi:hypothetical protein